jgi:hypothetical protein
MGFERQYRNAQSDCVVRCMHKVLLRAKIPLDRLDRSVAKQQLDLL